MMRCHPLLLAPLFVVLQLVGCRAPNKANIELRKKNQDLRAQVAQLQSKNDQLRGDMQRLESQSEGNTLPTLPTSRLSELFTVADVTFGRLTGVDDGAPGKPLKVYLTPVDSGGDTIKAVGDVTVEAFNLSADQPRLGKWEFPAAQVKKLWTGLAIGGYVLTCPWQDSPPPPGTKMTLKVTFVDALTGRTVEAKKDVG